jgi:hypothetical protein
MWQLPSSFDSARPRQHGHTERDKEMNGRREIQVRHEDAVIAEYIRWIEANGGPAYTVAARPDPPDAILHTGDRHLWVEVADVYRSADEAHEERSRANPSEQLFVHREHPITDPDDRMAASLLRAVKSKMSSHSYREVFEQYGPGVLICCERDPLFDADTLESTLEALQHEREEIERLDRKYFNEIYLYERPSGSRPLAFHRLLPSAP